MTEPIEKAKKKGKKAPREREPGAIVMARAHQEALQQECPDMDKAKRTVGAEAKIPVCSSDGDYEQHAQLGTTAGAVGSRHFPQPGEDPASIKSLGTPPGNPFGRAIQFMAEQGKGAAGWAVSAGQRAAAGNPASVPDFNAERASRNDGRIAVGARDLMQQPQTVFSAVLSRLTANPYHALGQTGFSSDFSFTDRPVQAPGDQVRINAFDAAASAGSMTGMNGGDVLDSVDYRPQVRTEYHQHRDSATPPNGTHSLGNPESHAVSNKSRFEIIRDEDEEAGSGVTIFARSDLRQVAVSPAHGGCGGTHARPEVNGFPVAIWGLDCDRCESYLSGANRPKVLKNFPGDLNKGIAPKQERVLDGDPLWSTSRDTIPLTPDEARDDAFLRTTAQHQINAMNALSSAITAGLKIPPEMMQLLRKSLPSGMIPGTMLCASGHDNTPGARYCQQCGIRMADQAELEAA